MKSKTKLTVAPHVTVDVSKFDVEQLRFLYKKACDNQQQRDQWAKSQNYDRAANYAAKLEALIEVIENITVFNVGNGIHPFEPAYRMVHNNSLDKRLASIGLIFDYVANTMFKAAKPVKSRPGAEA